MADSFSLAWPTDEIQTGKTIAPSSIVLRHKLSHKEALRKEKLAEFLTELPAPGESLHTISNGAFDYFQFVPRIIHLAGRPARQLYASTWTMNRQNVASLFELLDRGEVKACAVVTGLYFKARETTTYSNLLNGLVARKQRLKVLENHAKIALLDLAPDFYVLEGSANFTANPRIEQNALTNSRPLFEFHGAWMEDVLAS